MTQPDIQPNKACPACESTNTFPFYHVTNIPAHSVLCLETKKAAVSYPAGDIELRMCSNCGFAYNALLDPHLQAYSEKYEASQAFSPTFNKFNERIARDLIAKYHLQGKTFLEIGCGNGEFLKLVCGLAGSKGIGFDPAFREDVGGPREQGNLRFISDLYGPKYGHIVADVICCKMTLEHISKPLEFMRTVRSSISNSDATIFFQIPNLPHVLWNGAFWDVYYEHCSYYSPASLASLFERSGFTPKDVWTDFDNQYLMIVAKPAPAPVVSTIPKGKIDDLVSMAKAFEHDAKNRMGAWKEKIGATHTKGLHTVVWSSSSKAVAFLTCLGLRTEVDYVIDINTRRQGYFMAGTGQEICAPERLLKQPADLIVIMNPIYLKEISAAIKQLGAESELLTIDQMTR